MKTNIQYKKNIKNEGDKKTQQCYSKVAKHTSIFLQAKIHCQKKEN
jgi:hypothetical protein